VATTYTKELLNPGDAIAVDDGIMSFTVLERIPHGVKTRVENSGVISPNKGINFPMKTIRDLPAVSERDRLDVLFAIEQEVDFISISCMRDIEDIEEVRLLLGNSRVKLIAKIENKTGMDNFESILKMCDAIVIDRGYLGAEVDVAVVAIAQKKMISLVFEISKI
jgi:pyruvate kinase